MSKKTVEQRIHEARQAGYSDTEIYQALAKSPKYQKQFNGSYKKGMTDQQIAQSLGLKIGGGSGRTDSQADKPKPEKPSFAADMGRTAREYGAGIKQGALYATDKAQDFANKVFGTKFDTKDYERYTAKVADELSEYAQARQESGKGFDYGGLAVDFGLALTTRGVSRGLRIGQKAIGIKPFKKANDVLNKNTYKSAMARGALGGATMEGVKFAENADERIGNATAGAIGGGMGGVVGQGISKTATRAINAKNGHLVGQSKEIMELGKKHGVRLSVGDVGRGKITSKAEVQMERVPLVGMGGFRESQQSEAKEAVGKVVDSLKDKLGETDYKSLPRLQAAAARGEKNATRIMKIVNEAGDDPAKIIQASAEIKAWRGEQMARQIYDRVARMAGDDVVSPAKTIQAIDDVIAEQPKRMPNEELVRELTKIRASLTNTDPELGNINFKEMRAIQSRLGEMVSEWGQAGKSTSGLSSIRSAINDDLNDFAQQSGKAGLMNELKRANLFYADMMKRKDRTLAQAIKSNTPDEIFDKFVKANKANRAENFYNNLDQKGQAALRYSMAENALKKAYNPNTNTFSPAKFAQEFERLREPYEQIFKGFDKAQMDGFVKLMRHVERAGQYMENPPTGQRVIELLMAGGTFTNPALAAKGLTASAIAKVLFTTNAGKQLLLAAKDLPPNSPKLSNLLRQLESLLTMTGISLADD